MLPRRIGGEWSGLHAKPIHTHIWEWTSWPVTEESETCNQCEPAKMKCCSAPWGWPLQRFAQDVTTPKANATNTTTYFTGQQMTTQRPCTCPNNGMHCQHLAMADFEIQCHTTLHLCRHSCTIFALSDTNSIALLADPVMRARACTMQGCTVPCPLCTLGKARDFTT